MLWSSSIGRTRGWTVRNFRNYSFPENLPQKLDCTSCCLFLYGNKSMHLKIRWRFERSKPVETAFELMPSDLVSFIRSNTPSFQTGHGMPLRRRSLPWRISNTGAAEVCSMNLNNLCLNLVQIFHYLYLFLFQLFIFKWFISKTEFINYQKENWKKLIIKTFIKLRG